MRSVDFVKRCAARDGAFHPNAGSSKVIFAEAKAFFSSCGARQTLAVNCEMDPIGISATRFAAIITARRFLVAVPKHLAAAEWTFLLDFVCMFAAKPALAEQLDLVARHWTLVAVFREAGVAAFGIHAAVRAERSALAMGRVQALLRTRVGRNPDNHTACCPTFEPLAPRSIKAAARHDAARRNRM